VNSIIIIVPAFPHAQPPSVSVSAAAGGISLFTNEDMEKALGVAATKDLGQVESTQL
jgi:2-methylcitrate dehydratase PrpD